MMHDVNKQRGHISFFEILPHYVAIASHAQSFHQILVLFLVVLNCTTINNPASQLHNSSSTPILFPSLPTGSLDSRSFDLFGLHQ
jgi:hypothetical protein